MPKILIIAGATASGKTGLAIECARKFNGEIISADSMQIYKDLNIGTAKPTESEQKLCPHHLIDVVEPNANYSVQEFVTMARGKIEDVFSRGKLPIVVGGTGLYIKSLVSPYSFCSAPKNEEIHKKYEDFLEKNGKEKLFELLKERDPVASKRIHLNDTKRVIRALEIIDISGKTKTEQTQEAGTAIENFMVILSRDREELYSRINARVEEMFEMGLEKEIKTLLNNGKVDKDCQSMQAIGYKEFFKYFDGEIDFSTLKEQIKQHSRNYAKRQETFFRGSFKDAVWVNPTDKNKIFELIKDNI